jgi:hypothetical protein
LIARLTVLMVLATLGAMAVGCGDDDEAGGGTSAEVTAGGSEESEVTTSSLSKSQYVQRANRACEGVRADYLTELVSYTQKHRSEGKPRSELARDTIREVLLPIAEAESTALRELGAPAGDEEQIEAILAAQQKAIDELAEAQEELELGQVPTQFAAAGKLARSYGMGGCDTGPAPEGSG